MRGRRSGGRTYAEARKRGPASPVPPGSAPAAVLALLALSGLAGAVGGAVAAGAPGETRLSTAQQEPNPHSSARLISASEWIRPGEPFMVGIHVTLDDGWHTYWRNAGDAGNGMVVDWRLPAGFSVDSLEYPRPERIPYPPLMSYGYNDEVVLLARVTPPADLDTGSPVELVVDAQWLVCEEICIPAAATLDLTLPVRSGAPPASEHAPLIARYADQRPIRSEAWELRSARTDSGFVLGVRPPEGRLDDLRGAYFFPHDPVLLDHTAPQPSGLSGSGVEDGSGGRGEVRLRLVASPYMDGVPDTLTGILTVPEGSAFDGEGHRSLAVRVPVQRGEAATWAAEPVSAFHSPQVADAEAGTAGAVGSAGTGAANAAGAGGGLSLLAALAFAFLGGVILNLMPCVFPVLSLKALGFATRGGDRRAMRLDGVAFGAGVVVTFLVVAAVLLAIRASGGEIGWGYQLQSPTLVALLAALMFGLGLVLAGVVDIGSSLTRLGGLSTGGGYRGAFLTGVLAVLVATPCTAPFMGAAIGAALVRPPAEGLTIFAGLGLGMAAPYVALSFMPALAQRLPRPGRWMETFKQLLAFPMFAVAIWLVWVFGLQVGMGGAARLLFGLLLLALAAWLVGRWPAATVSSGMRWATRGLATVALVVGVLAAVAATDRPAPVPAGPGAGAAEGDLAWQPFSAERVRAEREAGRPVFVDFTAAWCISCQVNERVALHSDEVRAAFEARDVALLKADWTRRDPEITRALESFGRSGVPLYVLYPADSAAEPRILPALLTPGTVLEALDALPGDAAVATGVDS